MGNSVAIRNGQAHRIDPSNSSNKGSVGSSHAIEADSDGEYIVIVYENGFAKRYDADTGSHKGSIGQSHVTWVQHYRWNCHFDL